jgi:hypothetical protein
MGWVNPALTNFHSLDWGYDDLTVGRGGAARADEIVAVAQHTVVVPERVRDRVKFVQLAPRAHVEDIE